MTQPFIHIHLYYYTYLLLFNLHIINLFEIVHIYRRSNISHIVSKVIYLCVCVCNPTMIIMQQTASHALYGISKITINGLYSFDRFFVLLDLCNLSLSVFPMRCVYQMTLWFLFKISRLLPSSIYNNNISILNITLRL